MKRNKWLITLTTCAAAVGLAAGSAFAMNMEFHGSMWQAVGASNNMDSMRYDDNIQTNRKFLYSSGGQDIAATEIANLRNLDNSKGDIAGFSKARIDFVAKTDDGLAKFVYGLEVGTGHWGDSNRGFALSGDGVTQETRFVYAELAIPGMGKNHTVTAGLQPVDINQWLWKETAAGLVYKGKQDETKWQLGWVRGDNNATNDDNNNDDYFFGKVDSKLSKEISLGGFLVYSNLGQTFGENSDVFWAGLTGKMDMGGFFGDTDFIYQTGEVMNDYDTSAYLFDINAGFKASDQFKLWANFVYVSGDDDANDRDIDNFNSIDTDVAIGQIFFKEGLFGDCNQSFSEVPYIFDKGLMSPALYGQFKMDDKNTIKGAIRYLMTAEDIEITSGGKTYSDDTLGTELDLWYNYAYNKNVDLKFEAAYLFAGDAADMIVDDIATDDADDIFQAIGGAVIKF